MMGLSSLQLDAFLEVYRKKNFSRAAEALHLSQPALSQRILNLESELGATLFIRDTGDLRLTELSRTLLAYCQQRESLERELLSSFTTEDDQLAGSLRIAGFSSVMRSLILPVLTPLLQENPHLNAEIMVRELHEIPGLLARGEAEFVLLNRELGAQGVLNHLIGYEENVLIEPVAKLYRSDTYLDHDQNDTTTADFFKIQKDPPKKWTRLFLDDIYTIMDAVEAGLGRAVAPLHLVQGRSHLRVVPKWVPLKTPIYFSYFRQSCYTSLQKRVIAQLSCLLP